MFGLFPTTYYPPDSRRREIGRAGGDTQAVAERSVKGVGVAVAERAVYPSLWVTLWVTRGFPIPVSISTFYYYYGWRTLS